MRTYPERYIAPLCAALVMILLSCSTGPIEVGDGGTDLPNTKTITGIIVDTDGSEIADAQVKLIPENFNPVKDGALPDSLIDTTGADGVFTFSFNDSTIGLYNLHAVHLSKGTQWFQKEVTVANYEDSLNLSHCVLTEPGAVKVVLADTVDTANGFIYIMGTTIIAEIHNGIYLSGNHYSVVISDLPAVCLPPIIYSQNVQTNETMLVSDTTEVVPRDTVIAGTNDGNLKPMWRFSLLVGVTEKTVQYFSSIDSVRSLIEDHVARTNKKFNDPEVFNGIIEYYVDSVYQLTRPVSEEMDQPYNCADYRLIYDGFSCQSSGSWKKSNNTMYQVWDIEDAGGLFGDLSRDVLAWLFGAGRGCLPISWITVKAENNPINGQAYRGITSIMNYPFGVDKWDEYNIHVINHVADAVFDGENIIHTAFPASMGVVTRTDIGLPLANVEITVYGVKWNSKAVSETILLSGTTNPHGEYVFPGNPFKPDSCSGAIYGNLLINAVHGIDTAYTWMPINEVGLAYFTNPTSHFKVTISFDKSDGKSKQN